MKKWIGLFAVLGLVGVVWWVVRQQRVQLDFRQAKTEKIDRGDIRVPITAPGRIEPIQRFEVKSKAGGEVKKIHVKAGDYAHQDDILVELDPKLEQRNRDRAKSDLNIAKAQLEDVKISVKDAAQQVLAAQGTLEDLSAATELLKEDYDRVRESREQNKSTYNKFNLLQTKSSYERNLAQIKTATARLRQADNSVDSRKLAVQQQIEAVSKFQKILDDAQERLDDTTIRAPQDGIVTDVAVTVGAKIQSGVSSLGTGTLLLLLADVSTLEVVALVDEADWGRIVNISPVDALPDVPGNRDKARRDAEMLTARTGKVTLEVDAFPDEEFEGKVVRVEPQGRQNTGATVIQFAVHVEITDAQRDKLPLGAQAQVTFTVESALNTLRVPVDAVKSRAGKSGVWIPAPPPPGQKGRGKKFIPCEFTISDGEYAAVEQTDESEVKLKEGQEVYVKLPPDRDSSN